MFGNLTMLDDGGTTFGGTNDVATIWDGTLNADVSDTNFNMTMGSDSNFPFFGFQWFAHDIRVFGPGSYSFDTSCSIQQIQGGSSGDCGNGCDANPDNAGCLKLDIPADMIGAHVLFDWNVTENIDVVLLWDMNGVFTNPDPNGSLYQGPAGPTPPADCVYELVSRDADGDTVPGAKMIDGPFIDFRANFNVNLTQNCGGGGEVVSVKSSVNSPDTGCTISKADIEPWKRSDMLLLLAFAAWLGLRLRRRTTLH